MTGKNSPIRIAPIRIAIVGVGKIARDQHLPALAANQEYRLVAAASPHGRVEGIANYPTIEAMLNVAPEIDAVSLCMPPQARYDAARMAIEAGKHVFLEKPPGATVSEVEDLKRLARDKRVSLFASWHSRYAPAVETAREFLASTHINSARIDWKEDVRHWHPGQKWIWAPGGFGVFDPGINALSIATHIFPAMFIKSATLDFPANRDAPIAARIAFRLADGTPLKAVFDWRQTGKQTWTMTAETEAGRMRLADGGSGLTIDGRHVPNGHEGEYPALYRRFAQIIRQGISDVDLAPLQHVADAFMLAKRNVVDAFRH